MHVTTHNLYNFYGMYSNIIFAMHYPLSSQRYKRSSFTQGRSLHSAHISDCV